MLFCIDQDYKDKHVEESLAGLGQVYYINRLDDLVSVVVEISGEPMPGKVLSPLSRLKSWRAGIG